jgi:hypothetical protein
VSKQTEQNTKYDFVLEGYVLRRMPRLGGKPKEGKAVVAMTNIYSSDDRFKVNGAVDNLLGHFISCAKFRCAAFF